MAAVAITQPFSRSLVVSASSQFEVHQYPFTQLPAKAVHSHYRPYSTIYLVERKPSQRVLVKANRQSLQRSTSVGMGLGIRKVAEKKSRDKAKELPNLCIFDTPDTIPSVPMPPLPSPSSSSTKSVGGSVVSRPRMSAERSPTSGIGKAAPKVKVQRSMASLFSAGADVSPNMVLSEGGGSKPTSPISPRSRRPSRVDDVISKKDYVSALMDNNPWQVRSNTRLHGQPGFVPYMQAYDRVSLDSDRYTELLIQRLNPRSPSFHDYGRKPPSTVVELGCGEGYWCAWAASMWPRAAITGIDIVNITGQAFRDAENTVFKMGNFLDGKLPFHDGSIEYVRMANLTLAIPFNMWTPLFEEIHRILAPGGRVEVIDDQLSFPYGEVPKHKDPEAPIGSIHSKCFGSSFFDSDSDDDDTLEEATTMSNASTLVSDYDFNPFLDKSSPPGSKRSSTQSNRSVKIVEAPVGVRTPVDLHKPLPISPVSSTTPPPPLRGPSPAISPSPTVTQGNLSSLDQCTLAASETFTQHDSPFKQGLLFNSDSVKSHRRKSSASSTSTTAAELVTAWQNKAALSVDMESIFEHVIWRQGIHPRPSSFVPDIMRGIFGPKNAGKIKSYHITLAPYDSPIGPGGAMAPKLPPVVPPVPRPPLASTDSLVSTGQIKKHWRSISNTENKKDKEVKKEIRKQERQMARLRAESSASTGSRASRESTDRMPPPIAMPPITPKAARQLGIKPTVEAPKRLSREISTGSEDSSVESTSSIASDSSSSLGRSKPLPPIITDHPSSAAGAVLLSPPPPPVPPKSILVNRSMERLPTTPTDPPINSNVSALGLGRPGLNRGYTEGVPHKAAERLGLIVPTKRTMSRSISAEHTSFKSSPMASEPFRQRSKSSTASSGEISRAASTDSSLTLNGEVPSSVSSASDGSPGSGPLIATPPQALSGKVAEMLGAKYSVLAAASATHSRGSGVMVPVQSPGLLIWPSTYIAMSPTELEMHACKSLQTLLGHKHQLRCFVLKSEIDGQKATREEFDDALWEYECFRRSRFHWPNDNPELFAEQEFPHTPSPTAIYPTGDVRPGSTGRNRDGTLNIFNGQYRRDELTHLRTIRVYEGVKSLDDCGDSVKSSSTGASFFSAGLAANASGFFSASVVPPSRKAPRTP